MDEVYVECDYCNGTGKYPPYKEAIHRVCPICDGRGRVWITKEAAEREILQAQVNKLRRKR